jgi:hypothetical protein
MATINVFNPVPGVFTNLPPAAVSGDVALLNILIELRLHSQLLVMLSNGVAIKDNLQSLRIDESNSPV